MVEVLEAAWHKRSDRHSPEHLVEAVDAIAVDLVDLMIVVVVVVLVVVGYLDPVLDEECRTVQLLSLLVSSEWKDRYCHLDEEAEAHEPDTSLVLQLQKAVDLLVVPSLHYMTPRNQAASHTVILSQPYLVLLESDTFHNHSVVHQTALD